MRLPAYSRHKSANRDRAFVKLNGVRHYLGRYDSPDPRRNSLTMVHFGQGCSCRGR